MNRIKLKIADVIIGMRSEFPIEASKTKGGFRYKNFIYKGSKPLDICIEVFLVKTLPLIGNDTKKVFATHHFESGELNWALFKNTNYYVLREYPEGKKQHYIIRSDFCKARAYLLRKKKNKLSWAISDIIYDALQIILIQYLCQKGGIFTHAMGIKDKDGKGLLFVGKSGRGKSTAAKLWHKHSGAKVLNDDRIIVRKFNNRFFIYGTPWHGDFYDYLASRTERARLSSIFFINHSRINNATPMKKRIFKFFYPCIFPTFWDSGGLKNIIATSHSLIKNVPCFRLGFRKSKEVIGFARRIATREARNS